MCAQARARLRPHAHQHGAHVRRRDLRPGLDRLRLLELDGAAARVRRQQHGGVLIILFVWLGGMKDCR